MSKGVGRVFKRKQRMGDGSLVEDPVWHIAYYHRGKEYRESSHSASEEKARRLLRKRIQDIGNKRFVPNEDRLTFDDLVGFLENDYQVHDRRSLSTAANHVRHLRGWFGLDRAVDITPDRVLAYQSQRLNEGASRATCNREVACLGRMLSLAVELNRLSFKPKFKLLEGERIREGFLAHGDFLNLVDNLPDYLKGIVGFLYYSGWRIDSVRKLEWKDVDLEGRTARLRIENSKNREPWVVSLAGELWDIIQIRLEERRLDCRYVFHRNGKPIGNFRKAFATAQRKSGLSDIVPHDMKRCTARNLSRAGVPREVAMKFTGHKTASMYTRYRIVDESELKDAQEALKAFLAARTEESKVASLGGRG